MSLPIFVIQWQIILFFIRGAVMNYLKNILLALILLGCSFAVNAAGDEIVISMASLNETDNFEVFGILNTELLNHSLGLAIFSPAGKTADNCIYMDQTIVNIKEGEGKYKFSFRPFLMPQPLRESIRQ